MCLFFVFIISALITNSTDKFNKNTSEYLLINGFFTGNITHTPRFGKTMKLKCFFLTFAFVNLTFSPDHGFYRHRSAFIAHSFRRNNEFKLFLHILLFLLLVLCIILARLSSSYFSPDRVFRPRRSAIIARPLGRKQPFAVEFYPFCHFAATFIAAIAHIHPKLRFFRTHSQFFLIPPGLLLANKKPPMFLTGPPFYCRRRRTRFNICILLLLIIGGS